MITNTNQLWTLSTTKRVGSRVETGGLFNSVLNILMAVICYVITAQSKDGTSPLMFKVTCNANLINVVRKTNFMLFQCD